MTKARVNADNASADIQGVTAGTGLSGGGTSGTVTLTNDMATAIDAKGDLVVGTGADTYDNLAVGNNGEQLLADSAATTGLRYQAPKTQNAVYNSGYDIWQRGTSFSQTAAIMYSADRWCSVRAGLDVGSTISRQTTSDTTNLPNITYCARVQRNNANTSAYALYYAQTLENLDSARFAGQTITFSFYARKGANYSSASSILSIDLNMGTGTNENVLGTYTGAATVISTTKTLTTTWQRFTATATIPTTATQLGWYFSYTPVGTAGAADYFEVTGVQLEVGSVATPFNRMSGTIQGELAACQRYYQRKTSVGNGTLFGMGQCQNTTNAYYLIPIPVVFRVAPSVAHSGVVGWTSSTGNPGGTIAVFLPSADSVSLQITGGAGLVAGNASGLAGSTSSSYLELSAEL